MPITDFNFCKLDPYLRNFVPGYYAVGPCYHVALHRGRYAFITSAKKAPLDEDIGDLVRTEWFIFGPLMLLILSGHKELLVCYLPKTDKKEKASPYGYDEVIGYISTVNKVHGFGAFDVEKEVASMNWHLLMNSNEFDMLALAKYLIEVKGVKNIPFPGSSLLFYKYYIEHGGSLKELDLYHTITNGTLETLKYLHEQGVVLISFPAGQDAVFVREDFQVIQFFYSIGMDMKAGLAPAFRYGNEDLLKYLIAVGVPYKGTDVSGFKEYPETKALMELEEPLALAKGKRFLRILKTREVMERI